MEGCLYCRVPRHECFLHDSQLSERVQSEKNPVGVLALPTGKLLRVRKVFCAYLQNWLKVKSEHSIVSGLSGRFLERVEGFWTVWKVSVQSGKVLNNLEGFELILNVSGQPRKFLDNLEGLQPIWKRQRYVITWTKSLKLSTSKSCQ